MVDRLLALPRPKRHAAQVALTALCCSGLLALSSSLSGCSDDSSPGGAAGGTGGNGSVGGAGDMAGESPAGSDAGQPSAGGSGPMQSLEDLEEHPAPEAAWTFLVYGHGDHNLSNSLLNDLQEMARARAGAPGELNVLALTDWDASQAIAGTDPPQAFPDGIQLFRVPGSGAELELLAEGPEANLDDPAVLTELVSGVFTAFPARRRAVVLWDHGGAWSGGFGSDTQNGTVLRPTGMPAQAIPPAIAAGLEAAGVTTSPPLDIIAFDTCLMAGAEVVYPFRDLASVFIGNAEIDYGAGWDYEATLSYLAKNPDEDAAAVAQAEVGHWDAHHAESSANDALLRSHVALDLSAVDAFAAATLKLTGAIAASQSLPAVDLGRAGFFALPPYASQFENAGSSAPGLRDFGQFLDTIATTEADADVAAAAKQVHGSLTAMVLARSQGSLRESSGQAGVHIELSPGAQLGSSTLASYAARASQWAKASGWRGLLGSLADAADATPPSFLHSIENAEGAGPLTPPVLDLTTLDADTAKGSIYFASLVNADTVALLGLIGSGVLDPASQYTFEWDGTVATFSDGQPAMLDIWLDVGSGGAEPVLMVPGALTAGGQQLQANLVFTPSEAAATAAVVSLGDVASTMSLSEIAEAFPDAAFTPTYVGVRVSTGMSDVLTGQPIPLPSSGRLEFGFDYVTAGSHLFFTSVTDVWGNVSTEADAFELLEPLGP